QSIEVLPDGTPSYVLEFATPEYRSYRLRTLYEGTDDALAGAPRKVESVALNDGSAQRSMVNRITVTFGGAAVLDPGAIELRRQDGSLVDVQVSISLVGGKTVAVLTFVGTEFVGGSLADGSYTLTVRADRVHDRWGRELDGDGNGSAGGDRVDGFFRLFGDSDGDRDVDWQDRDLFRSAVGKSATDAGFPTVPRSVGRPLPAQLQPRPELPRRHKPSGRADGRLQRRRPAGPRGRQHLQQHGQRAAGQRRRHVPAGAELRHRRRPALSR